MTTIITKNGSGAPTAGQLSQGELAVDLTNKELYTKDSGGNIIKVGSQGGSSGTFTDLVATDSFTSPGIDDNATSTAITIDANENVGIGIVDPKAPLHLNDYLQITTDGTGHESGNGSVLSVGAAGELYLHNYEDADVRIGTNNITRMTIDGAGNVGIGTSTPDQALVVDGSIALSYNSTSSYQGIKRVGVGTVYYTGTTSTSTSAIHTFTGSGDAAKMTILESGNVGIGTDDPASKLHVKNTGGSGVIQIGTAGGTAAREWKQIASSGNGSYYIQDATAVANRLAIDISGNVGIGTPTPTSLLHVCDGLSSYTNTTTVITGSAQDDGDSGISLLATGNALGGRVGSNYVADGSGGLKQSNTGRTSGFIGFSNPTTGGVTSSISFGGTLKGSVTPVTHMTLDGSGNLLVGTTTYGPEGTKGIQIGGSSGASTGVEILRSGTPVNGYQSAMFQKHGSGFSNVGCYKHSGITDPAGYFGTTDGNAAPAFLWHNGGTWRTSSSSANIGTASGTVVGTQTSDERLKDIEPSFEYGLDAVMALKPIAYTRNDEDSPVRQLGFGAQTTQAIVPEAVYDTGECLDGYDVDPDDSMVQTAKSDDTKLAMEYVQIVPVLVKAMQEQQAMIETLQAEVEALKNA